MATKPQPKKPEPEDKTPARAPDRPRTQQIQGTPAQATTHPAPSAGPRLPMPRPVFGQRGDATQAVVNALQQTVRSQAVLIRNYQELLHLGAMVDEETDQPGEGEAA